MRLQNLTQAKHFLNLALEKVRAESEFVDQSYTKSLRTTIRYNIARLSEEMYAFDKGMSFFIYVQIEAQTISASLKLLLYVFLHGVSFFVTLFV